MKVSQPYHNLAQREAFAVEEDLDELLWWWYCSHWDTTFLGSSNLAMIRNTEL